MNVSQKIRRKKSKKINKYIYIDLCIYETNTHTHLIKIIKLKRVC